MRSRRLACLLLGIWMGAGLWMYWIASQNSQSATEMSLRPAAAVSASIKALGRTQTLQLAQYLVAEETRAQYEVWGTVQIALSACLFFFLLFGTRMGKFPLMLALVLLLLAVAERVLIFPDMGAAASLAVDSSRRVRMIGAALTYGFTASEVIKWLLMTVLGTFLIWEQARRSRDSRNQVDMIDKPDYGHVNR